MSYASVISVGKRFKACIVIRDGETSRCFVLDGKGKGYKREEDAMAAAITVFGLLHKTIEEFLRKRGYEEQ
jgi:hypothetical protein